MKIVMLLVMKQEHRINNKKVKIIIKIILIIIKYSKKINKLVKIHLKLKILYLMLLIELLKIRIYPNPVVQVSFFILEIQIE